MTRKNITAATIRNVSTALRKSPWAKRRPLIVNASPAKFCLPPTAAISGVTMSLTSALTTAVNAVPMTTATARSTRFPRRTKARNSRSIGPTLRSRADGPDAVLRRHGRLGADRAARAAGDSPAPRRRPAAVRLRGGHPAPAPSHGGPARHRGRLPHAPPRRPLARAAGDAEVVRPARPRRAARRVRAPRDRRAHARDAHRLRPPRLPIRRRRARGRRGGAVRRLRGRRVQRPPPHAGLRLRDRRGGP